MEENHCFHCGDACTSDKIILDDKVFCCLGCKTVYEILQEYSLHNEYYRLDSNPGVKKEEQLFKDDFAYLDLPEIQKNLIAFSSPEKSLVEFKVPTIHCTSCIWLLENLRKIEPGVIQSKVNFLSKEVSVQFEPKKISLRNLVERLNELGYSPNIEIDEKSIKKKAKLRNQGLIYRLGIAGFAFGNIMLLSFPEYLSEGLFNDELFGSFFGYINLILSLPVFLYCAYPYFQSAYKGLKEKFLNIDVPISLGIITLFVRSTYEVLLHTGAGYFDSLTGLVFFLLIGRWFQNRTYQSLSFERDYKSYFPLAITRISGEETSQVMLNQIEVGNNLLIRNGEIIPADSIIVDGQAKIDYSFVTGEADPILKNKGDEVFAGGRQIGGQIQVKTFKDFSQSYLMKLWKNEDTSSSKEESLELMINVVSKYFTFLILLIALVTGIYWFIVDSDKAVLASSSVLIIACPCALALTVPFTFGNGLRILEKVGLYLKDAKFIERLSKIDLVIFDKTGTITIGKSKKLEFVGEGLLAEEKKLISALVQNSSHPLSSMICDYLRVKTSFKPEEFEEITGAGLKGVVNAKKLKIGSATFLNCKEVEGVTSVHVEIENTYRGYFRIENDYRTGLGELVKQLQNHYQLEVITGDGESEKFNLQKIFGANSKLHFKKSPTDKLEYLRSISHNKTLMIGDGLNDAGAIRESYVGISIADNIHGFMPACDGILESNSFQKLNRILMFTKSLRHMVYCGFIISFLYNLIGLFFAVQGLLSPIIAAILMPLSSITVVGFAILSTNLLSNKV